MAESSWGSKRAPRGQKSTASLRAQQRASTRPRLGVYPKTLHQTHALGERWGCTGADPTSCPDLVGVTDPWAQGSEPAHSLLQDLAAGSSPLQPPFMPLPAAASLKTQLMAAAVENQCLSLPMKEVITALLPPGAPLFSKRGTEGCGYPNFAPSTSLPAALPLVVALGISVPPSRIRAVLLPVPLNASLYCPVGLLSTV